MSDGSITGSMTAGISEEALDRSTLDELPAAVLWDMDGTVVDTEPFWIAAEHELVESHGGTWTQELAHQCVGNPLLKSAEIIRANTPVSMSPERIVDWLLDRVIASMRAHVPLRPGVTPLLDECRAHAVPCALVTMSYKSFASVLVDALPAGTFGAVVTGDEVTNGKPDAEPYRRAAELLGVDPVEAIAIEDSPTGVRSSVAAGVPTIAVPNVVKVPNELGAVTVPSLEGMTLAQLTRLAREHRRSAH